jgi:hypothetical protein
VGEQYRKNAKTVRAIAAVILLFWIGLIVCAVAAFAGEM